jgi:hypothetical protein
MYIILVVFLQSLLFAFFHLNIRKLQDKGVSVHAIAGLHRYSIIPAIVFFILTYKREYLTLFIKHPIVFLWLLGIALFWGLAQYIGYILLNSTSSLSFIHSLGVFTQIPILFTMSILINKDYPNIYIIIGSIILIVALIFKPSQHKENRHALFENGIFIVIILLLVNQIAHGFEGAFYKNILQLLTPKGVFFGTSVYILLASSAMNIIYYLPIFKKTSDGEKLIIKKCFWTAYLIPVVWFVASIPEGYSFANLPLFTLSALGAFGFLIKLISDIKNKRLMWNLHTALFTILIITSIVITTISLK